MSRATAFNRSTFARWLNGPSGRVFRLSAGLAFVLLGVRYWDSPAGKASLVWSLFPLSAGGVDVCWISAALGGPFRGAACRAQGASPAN